MNFPWKIEIGNAEILLHSILEPLAFFTGFRYFLYLKKNKGDIVETERRVWIIIGAIFGSLLGSRLIGGFENPEQMKNAANLLLHFYMNKTVLGGLLGGLLGVEIIKKIIGEKKASGDLFVYPILLALIIGRIGCFSMGTYEETYGLPTGSILGMDLGDGMKRHPVALYEIAYIVLLWILLKKLTTKISIANGGLFKLFMISYIIFRFFVEFMKPHYNYWPGLSAIQITCVLGFVWYLPNILSPRTIFT